MLLKNRVVSGVPTLPLTVGPGTRLALVGPAGNYTPQTATSSYIGNYSPCEVSRCFLRHGRPHA